MGSNVISRHLFRVSAVVAALVFVYIFVLAKLGQDWWTDENYSHGLLVPGVIALLIWRDSELLASVGRRPLKWLGSVLMVLGIAMLACGVLGAELFISRLSLVAAIAGIVIYFFGLKVLDLLLVPLALLALSIPVPQIIFNKIAFPLQLWASQIAVAGIRLFDVPTLRKGNVIEILPAGSTQTIALEVVEACSGIRSLTTLVTLSLILVCFTPSQGKRGLAGLPGRDLVRALVLMAVAIPIAVVTNAARVTGTGLLSFKYGKQAIDGLWHDASGWLVFVVAMAVLFGLNSLLRSALGSKETVANFEPVIERVTKSQVSVIPIVALLCISGVAIHWFNSRSEALVDRRPLAELSTSLGDWTQRGAEIKFDPQTEAVLRTSDYTMREYTSEDGRIGNIYVGYYSSQRSGATYHSPLNCLPGAGWVMRDPQVITIRTMDGRTFDANRYIVQNGLYNEVMIYWYQGRGRTESSEYADKLNTIFDSVTRGRTDGALVRVMTSVGYDEAAAMSAATKLAATLADSLDPHVPN